MSTATRTELVFQNKDGMTTTVAVWLDPDKLPACIVSRAIRSKSGKATACGGVVEVHIVSRVQAP